MKNSITIKATPLYTRPNPSSYQTSKIDSLRKHMMVFESEKKYLAYSSFEKEEKLEQLHAKVNILKNFVYLEPFLQ